MNKFKIGVIGGGSWATALIKIFQENNFDINWWVRSEESIKKIKTFERNPNYLSSVKINLNKTTVHSDINNVVKNSDYLVFAVPSVYLSQTLQLINQSFSEKFIISAIKGIVPDKNMLVAEYFNKKHNISYEKILVVSGPCHAEEVALEKLSYLTLACQDLNAAEIFSKAISCRFIKIKTSKDIFGVEIAAVLKNVIAIASGICHSLGYGDNFQAVLVSNAIIEIENFVNKVNPIKREIKESVYLGDLLVTTYSQFSRNRTFGGMIGKGYSVRSAQLEMNMIAEGYYVVKCIKNINSNYDVEMPIIDAVYNILYKNSSPSKEMSLLSQKLS